MNKEIKRRIEQIRRGEVPKGYKKTKVGIVPQEWEETKLDLISARVTKKNTDGSIKITFTNSAIEGIIKQTDYFYKEISNHENISEYYIVEENDYIYNPRISTSAPCGPINKSYQKEKGIVSPLYTVFKMKNKWQANKYIELYLKSALWHHYICEVANYGARHDRMNITNDDFFGMPIPIPSILEQNKIAEIISTHDKLIELNQRKIEELKKLKKYYLSKMFPRNDSNVPEIRFKGFTEPWKQCRLGNISEKVTGKNQDMVYDEVFTNSAEYGIISQRDFFDKDIANNENIDGYYIVEPNDFVYNPRISNLAPFGPIRRNKLEKSGVMSPLYYVFRINGVDYGFLEYYFITNCWYRFMHLHGNSGARSDRFAIRDDIFKEMPITMPQDLAEQEYIGQYFTHFDYLITLHQRKHEELKKQKKSLMQLLLTGIVRVKT